MVKPVTCFEDRAGEVHRTPDAALAADIAALLGQNGKGIAADIIKKRPAIETAFAEFDSCSTEGSGKTAEPITEET